MKPAKTLFYPGLDGLRAIASLAVVFGHIELMKKNHQFANFFGSVDQLGGLAVILFFVLSGFLITSLLLREKDRQPISIKNFYLRRVLRVWPLYYLIIFLSAIIFSYHPDKITWVLCLSIFPNISHAIGHGWAVSPQIWSIGVEEQFYLFWPNVMKYSKKYLIHVFLLIMLVIPIMPHLIQFTLIRINPNSQALNLIEDLFEVLRFNCMAIGAILAIAIHKEYLGKIKPPPFFLSVLTVFILALWFSNFKISMFNTELYAVLFAILIYCVINGGLITILESRFFKFLGKISYGTYMYHWIILLLLFKILNPDDALFNTKLYALSLSLTILIASLSYFLVERKILRYKDSFN